ncbi:MAG: hypothetical protein QG661_1536 [Actinomycetota bacterium]|jgi:hypothetical protein|nr:hypothetical protein [Actinomycetota bacterium]
MVAGLAAGLAAPAHAATPKDRYALGDSVMLGAKDVMKRLGFRVVDAEESRQAYSGAAELRRRGASLPENVVVHLGTNGTFPLSSCHAMVKAAGPDRRVFLVTIHAPRSWEKGNNKVIRQCAADYRPGRVNVIDWNWAASRHAKWLYSDGIHLTPSGAKGYARVIDAAIDRAASGATASASSASATSASAAPTTGAGAGIPYASGTISVGIV